MSLLDEYEVDFDQQTKSRGREYFRQKKVKITNSDKRSVTAAVEGTEPYTTRVGWDVDGPVYECTCPFFVDHGEPCKHCWATVLQAQQEGVLPDPDEVEKWDDEDEPDAVRLPLPPQPAARSGARVGAHGQRDHDPK